MKSKSAPPISQSGAAAPAKRPASRRSGGPRTPEGRSAVASNALKHGINSALVVIAGEDAQAFEELFQGLVEDFQPQGTTETLIVHRIAHLVWKQRRLEQFEHDKLSQAALAPIEFGDILRRMDKLPNAAPYFPYYQSMDEYSEKNLDDAYVMDGECGDFKNFRERFHDPEQSKLHFPALVKEFASWAKAYGIPARDLFGLGNPQPDEEMIDRANKEVADLQKKANAIIFLVEHREEIDRARASVRAERMSTAWNLDRSHRYHSLLENQLYRALKELRTIQALKVSKALGNAIEASNIRSLS
jgi:hypothetical protein